MSENTTLTSVINQAIYDFDKIWTYLNNKGDLIRDNYGSDKVSTNNYWKLIDKLTYIGNGDTGLDYTSYFGPKSTNSLVYEKTKKNDSDYKISSKIKMSGFYDSGANVEVVVPSSTFELDSTNFSFNERLKLYKLTTDGSSLIGDVLAPKASICLKITDNGSIIKSEDKDNEIIFFTKEDVEKDRENTYSKINFDIDVDCNITSIVAGYLESDIEKIDITTKNVVSDLDVYVKVLNNEHIISGVPSANIRLESATTYGIDGRINTQMPENEKIVNIDPINVIEKNSYKDTYIKNGIQVDTEIGTASVEVGENVTGIMVDEYVQALYRRILGYSYTSVGEDL